MKQWYRDRGRKNKIKPPRLKRRAEKAGSSERIRFLLEQEGEGKSRNELRPNAFNAFIQTKEKLFKKYLDNQESLSYSL